MRILIRFLALVALIIAGAWLYFDQNFEPLLTTVVSFSTLLGTFYGENSYESPKQSQLVLNGATGVQANGNVSISVEKNERKDT